MCPEELVAYITAVSIAISKDKTIDELNILSVIFTQLGDTLATISTQKDYLESNDKN